VGLVPGSEGGGINLDDAVLHKGLGADQLVVGGVVYDIKNTGLLGGDYI
jgi:heptaprenylglyceryl phosphate synthase